MLSSFRGFVIDLFWFWLVQVRYLEDNPVIFYHNPTVNSDVDIPDVHIAMNKVFFVSGHPGAGEAPGDPESDMTVPQCLFLLLGAAVSQRSRVDSDSDLSDNFRIFNSV